jgi:glutamate N-acetyltransferase / amino-acid N-acetyltransferase
MKVSPLLSILQCLRLTEPEKEQLLRETEVPSQVVAAFFKVAPGYTVWNEVPILLEELSEFGECVRVAPDFSDDSVVATGIRDFFFVAVIPDSQKETLKGLFLRPWIERYALVSSEDRHELHLLLDEIGAKSSHPTEEDPEVLLHRVRSFILSGGSAGENEIKAGHEVEMLTNLKIVTSPEGFRSAGVCCGIKEGKLDLGLLVSDHPCVAAGRFTQNRFCSPPVQVCHEHLAQGDVRAVVINSGIANAATGAQGLNDARRMAAIAAGQLGLEPHQVLVCSTGVIGQFLPMEKIENGIGAAVTSLTTGQDECLVQAIMTTDTVMKYSSRHFQLSGKEVTLAGITKGAGMIHPNMATMLAFLTTDAAIRPSALQCALGLAVQDTFNCLTVDGDTSTSDSIILFANGKAGNEEIGPDHVEYNHFVEELNLLCQDLVCQMARDGEGATHLVRVVCQGAFNRPDAHAVSKAISGSLLVKTAIFGRDPNWGRIICAVGNTQARYRPDAVRLWVQGILLFENGMATEFDRAAVSRAMGEEEIEIRVDLGAGSTTATTFTCDLSYDYVRINAEYHT